MPAPLLSVIIPAFNRVDLLRHTLASVQAATVGIDAEIVLVDDGSSPPLSALLNPAEVAPVALRFVRQTNTGSAAARHRGFLSATGTWINFLDSDDLVAPEKYHRQLEAMRAADVDVSYTDQIERETDPADPARTLSEHVEHLPAIKDSTELFLRLHPAPHNLVYHRRVLRPFTHPWLPLRELYRPVGDTWTFYNLAPFPAKFLHLPQPLTIYRIHSGERYSRRWEATGTGAAGMMLEFIERCPITPLAAMARLRVAQNSALSLRALPRGMPFPWEPVLWHNLSSQPPQVLGPLGGRWFERARDLLGLKPALRLFRLIGRPRYKVDPIRVPSAELSILCRRLSVLSDELGVTLQGREKSSESP